MMRLPFARKIDDALRQLDRIPLYGYAPRIDVAHFAEAIAKRWDVSLSLTIAQAAWRSSAELYEGLESEALRSHLALFPLKGDLVWAMSRQDIARLTALLLKKRPDQVQSELLQEGFYLYLFLQALDALQAEPPLKEFTLRIHEETHRIERGYCMDVTLEIEGQLCYGRLILSDAFLTSWQSHFSSLQRLFSLSPLAKSLEVPLSITVGSVLLGQEQWNDAKPGDVLLLDRGSYDPRHKEGVASFSLGATPLFHVHIHKHKIKLLEPALFYEEDMDQGETTEQPVSTEEASTVAIKELPLFVTVELTRLRMTVEQLMSLAPGNFLELPIDPAQGVLLTVNGRKIGRGELVYLGEALGVRILE
jgi:type III secretion system YscQ/HrcQ family protein